MYTYACQLVRVIDGDSLVVEIDLGFRIVMERSVRLMGINCPEIRATGGKEARDFAAAWLSKHVDGLRIRTAKNPRDKYGRYLAVVYSGEAELNRELLEHGHAVSYG